MSATASSFDYCFSVTIGFEGGYVNNPADPGGETKYGISKRAYPNTDIANLTLDQAKAIYQSDYWSKAGCQFCVPALACLVFDAAVNNGAGMAARWLQAALGVVADGVIGPQTQAALAGVTDFTTLLGNFHASRIIYMASLPTWPTFGVGWSRRLAQLPYQAGQVAAAMGGLPTLTLV